MGKAKKKLLSENFEIKGVWYLPGQDLEKDAVEGILRYDPKNITLDLIGILEGDKEAIASVMWHIPPKRIIYGFSNYGEWFTLYDCITAGAQINAPGFSTVSYIVNRFYAGTQIIRDENDSIVENCTCSFSYLDAWMNIDIEERRTYSNGKKIEWCIDLDKAISQKRNIKIHPLNISIDEEIGYNVAYSKDYFSDEKTEIVLNRFYRLSSFDKEHLSTKFCIDNLQRLKKLITLLMGNALYFNFIDIILPCTKEREINGEEYDVKNICRVFFRQVGDINKPKRISPYIPGTILIYRDDIKNNMETIFGNWFLQQDLLSEIVNPYISDLYLPIYQETKFINIIRSLETYHRFYYDRHHNSLSKESDESLERERRSLESFVNENISENNKQFFLERIYYEGEKSLRSRLKDIFSSTPIELLNRLFGELSSKNRNQLFSEIVDTRNYFTHRDNLEKYVNAINDNMQLVKIIDQLTIILQYHVLNLIGLDSEIIVQRLFKYYNNTHVFNKSN